VLHLKLAPNEIGDSQIIIIWGSIRETLGSESLGSDHPKSFFLKNEKIHVFFLQLAFKLFVFPVDPHLLPGNVPTS